jgi:putative tryptophan/tyrosine transport system substrate-binding protein
MPCPEPQGQAMRRREFIKVIAGLAAAWPFAVHAQRSEIPIIGFLGAVSPKPFARRRAAFRQGLNETGFVEGRNLAIEYRWAEDQYDRLPALATDLVGRPVVVIVAYPDAAVFAAKAATETIPIIFLTGSDPVRAGIVPSLNRPGQSITGVSWFGADLVAKQLSLLHELVPNAAAIALLVDLNALPDAVSQMTSEGQAAARTLGLPALPVTSIRHLRTSRGSGPVQSSSAAALFLSAGAIKSLRSRRAMRFRRFMDFVSIPPTAA